MKNTFGFLQENKWQTLGIALAGLGAMAIARAAYRRVTSLDFREKVVVVTGGSRGLGLETARILAGRGARIVLCARSQEHLEIAANELTALGAEVLTIAADLSHQDEAPRVIEKVIGHFGRIDVLINNAGVMMVGPENLMEIEDYHRLMDANCWSALYMIKAALPHFRVQGGGRIANICSIGGKISVPHMLPYSVSKFALTGLSEGLAAELKKDNIHITTVVPNLMRTGSPRNISLKGAHEDEYAWFKIADSLPFLSMDARVAASEIVKGIAAGDSEVILTPIARAASAMNGIAPGAVTTIMQWTNDFLPQGGDQEVKKGFESESEATTGLIGSRTDEAAVRNNQI
ncbi:SDR family NAD(P)-dependent oxidoreductase [Dyadobacter sp. CY261]|uniref:SDR family NAD(P)-dependent oxidoreductase n=1 Tax=Dyadobacter sp. CY261 TaxID=2907203 RepID=UPI001F40784E|nr:SDR family NAD(P)-dependent oxidoreductase [Dyadobacter sp. CY261]MCF0069635.1 SDR family NAD(P)-dependent oxidoreductase [Dyadobacter sp. CY261]